MKGCIQGKSLLENVRAPRNRSTQIGTQNLQNHEITGKDSICSKNMLKGK